jgi:L-arabinose isomerase
LTGPHRGHSAPRHRQAGPAPEHAIQPPVRLYSDATRLGLNLKIVVGQSRDEAVHARTGSWSRAAGVVRFTAAQDRRFGDKMRELAVTEDDTVEAQARFGYSVNGFGVGDLACSVSLSSDPKVDRLTAEYA